MPIPNAYINSIKETGMQSEGSYDYNTNHRYVRTWRAEATTPTVDATTILDSANGIPNLRDTYSVTIYAADNTTVLVTITDTAAIVNRKYARRRDPSNPYIWDITCEYDFDPTQYPTEFSIYTEKYQKAIQKDTNSNIIANSAGDPYDPPVTIDDSRVIIIATKNMTTTDFNLQTPDTYKDKLNSLAFLGFAPLTIKCNNIGGERIKWGDIFYWRVRCEFAYDGGSWQKELLDQGFNVIDGTNKVKARDPKDGSPYSHPILLDGTGHQLANGGVPVYGSYGVYASVDFTPLGLTYP